MFYLQMFMKDFVDETWDYIKGFSDKSITIAYVIDDIEGLNLLYHNYNIGQIN